MKSNTVKALVISVLAVCLNLMPAYGSWDIYPYAQDDGGWHSMASYSSSQTQVGGYYQATALVRLDVIWGSNFDYDVHKIDNSYNWITVSNGNSYGTYCVASYSNVSEQYYRNTEAYVNCPDFYTASQADVFGERNPYN